MQEKDMNGKEIAKKVKADLEARILDFTDIYKVVPKLAIVVVGDDPSSATYIRSKQKACQKAGIESELHQLPEDVTVEEIRELILQLNEDTSIHGVILEMPLPQHIPYTMAVSCLSPVKDVDGLHPLNLGYLFFGTPVFVPNTPMAVMKLLEEYKVPLEGKSVTVVGRSVTVGKPLAALMLAENATVTICHSRTKDLRERCLQADVLVAAVGKPRLIKADMVKEGAVVIDVGINVVEGTLVGDVDYDAIYPRASLITPVPGGVGPLTVSMIMENTLKAARIQVGQKQPQNEEV